MHPCPAGPFSVCGVQGPLPLPVEFKGAVGVQEKGPVSTDTVPRGLPEVLAAGTAGQSTLLTGIWRPESPWVWDPRPQLQPESQPLIIERLGRVTPSAQSFYVRDLN